MKYFTCLTVLYLCTLFTVSAQQFKRIFLFDDFTEARIKFRNGSQTVVSLNYDASNKTMLFRQGEELMEVTNTSTVDTVFVGDRRFIPAEKGFYEVIFLNNGTVFVDWLLKDVNVGSKGALGAVTQGSVYNLQMSNFGLNGTEMYTPYKQQKLGSTDVYRRKSDNTYYINKENRLVKLKTLKQVVKAFPAFKDDINTFAKENDTDMKETHDVLMLLDYCLGFSVKEK